MPFMNRTFLPFIIMIAVAMSGCAGKTAKSDKGPEQQGPVIEDPTVTTEIIDGSQQEEQKWSADIRLCLVLGPGMARGLAHVGILDVLEEAKLPIHCIVGVEMGALVGTLYSMNRNLNKVQWQVFKIKKDVYLDYPIFSALRSSSVKTGKLRSILKEYLGFTRLNDYQIPISIGVSEHPSGTPTVLESSPGVDSILASIAVPEVFEAQKVENQGLFVSGTSSTPYPVRAAFERGATHVIVVDLLSDSFSMNGLNKRDQSIWKQMAVAKNIGRYQLQDANFVLRPNLGAYRFTDFNRRVEIIEAGKAAAKTLLPELRRTLSEAAL